jgi:hypothetical protein
MRKGNGLSWLSCFCRTIAFLLKGIVLMNGGMEKSVFERGFVWEKKGGVIGNWDFH